MFRLFNLTSIFFLILLSNQVLAAITSPMYAEVGETIRVSWTDNSVGCSNPSYKVYIDRASVQYPAMNFRITSNKYYDFKYDYTGIVRFKIAVLVCSASGSTYKQIRNETFTYFDIPKKSAYFYDALGRIVNVKDPINGKREFCYDAAGNRTRVQVGGTDLTCNGTQAGGSSTSGLFAEADYLTLPKGSGRHLISNLLDNDNDPTNSAYIYFVGYGRPHSGVVNEKKINNTTVEITTSYNNPIDYGTFEYWVKDSAGGFSKGMVHIRFE